MKTSLLKKSSYVFLSLPWLISFASKTEEPQVVLKLSQQERNEVIKHSEVPYAYLGSELSDIVKVVRKISDLYDNDEVQGVYELRDHVNKGYKIGRCDVVIEVLTEALTALDDDINSEKLAARLKDNIEKLQSGELNVERAQQNVRVRDGKAKKDIDAQLQAQNMPIVIEKEGITRDPVVEKIEGCLEVTNDALIERNLTVGNDLLVKDDATVRGDLVVKEELEVCGKSKFKKDAEFKKDVEIKDNLRVENKLKVSGKSKFEKDAKFKEDVEIEGDLFVEDNLEVFGNTELKDVEIDGNLSVIEDLVVCGDAEFKGSVVDIACDLFVGCNIFMKDTNSPVGNIFKEGMRFIHNFGIENTFVGVKAGNFTMTVPAIRNSGFGVFALEKNTTGRANTAGGFSALRNNEDGNENTAFGAEALRENRTGIGNTGMGQGSLRFNVGGNRNSGLGDNSLNINVSGSENTATGFGSVGFNLTGDGNTGVGFFAINQNEFGSGNTGVGRSALIKAKGNRNIALGENAGRSLVSGDDNIYIGSDAGFPPDDSVTESLQIRIGASQTDCYIQGIFDASVTDLPVFVNSSGKLGTTPSAEKYKSNIVDMGATSDNLMDLRPVTFTYNHDSNNKTHYGLIAEEVETVYPELVVQDSSGNIYSVRYHELPAMLLNELQKNREMITSLQDKDQSNAVIIQELKKTIKELLTEQQQNSTLVKNLLARIVVLEELTGSNYHI